MSMRTLPLVFINLGGEMLYILDQRLRAHNTSEDKSEKVMADIVGTMFSKAFMDELLTPQELYSHRTLKTVLTRLAHASIMRLNPASMDRLYELMVMAFKYQVLLCPRPKDLLLISYNHMDAIGQFVKDTPAVFNQVDETRRKINEIYTPLADGELQLLRQTLLIFFQDLHVRVSLFLNNNVQKPNGRFTLPTAGPVPHGTEVPGQIRTFNSRGREVKRALFPAGGRYSGSLREGSFTLHGDRVTRLGTNMYRASQLEETHTSRSLSTKTDAGPNPLAKEELNLLARLIGCMEARDRSGAETSFRVNLFATDKEEENIGASSEAGYSVAGVINIQAMQDAQASGELARIAKEFADREEQPKEAGSNSSKGDDLLAMMDTF